MIDTGIKEREGVDRMLPDGWKWVKLGDVCKIQNGYAFKSNSFLDKGIPVIKMGNINKNFSLNWEIDKLSYLPINYLEIYSTFLVKKNDLLITLTDMSPSGEYLGTVALYNLDSQALLNQRVGKFIDLSQDIDNNYLYFSLRDERFRKYATLDDKGNLQKNTNPDYLYKYDFPLPPLAEQKRIAAILNEQMEAVEKARKATEAQLEAAKELPAAYLRAVFNSPEAQKWERKKLHQVALITGGIQKTPNRSPHQFHYPYLTVRNVQRGWLDLSTLERFEITLNELEQYRLERGDLLIVEGNGSLNHIGRNAIFRGEIENCVHQNHVIRVRLHQESTPEFISYYLNSDFGKIQILKKAETTTGLHTLSVSKVQQIEVPIPPLKEQYQLANSIMAKFLNVDKLEKFLKSQLEAINQFPSAILRKAFNGEL